jgi:hypothetical protein
MESGRQGSAIGVGDDSAVGGEVDVVSVRGSVVSNDGAGALKKRKGRMAISSLLGQWLLSENFWWLEVEKYYDDLEILDNEGESEASSSFYDHHGSLQMSLSSSSLGMKSYEENGEGHLVASVRNSSTNAKTANVTGLRKRRSSIGSHLNESSDEEDDADGIAPARVGVAGAIAAPTFWNRVSTMTGLGTLRFGFRDLISSLPGVGTGH